MIAIKSSKFSVRKREKETTEQGRDYPCVLKWETDSLVVLFIRENEGVALIRKNREPDGRLEAWISATSPKWLPLEPGEEVTVTFKG